MAIAERSANDALHVSLHEKEKRMSVDEIVLPGTENARPLFSSKEEEEGFFQDFTFRMQMSSWVKRGSWPTIYLGNVDYKELYKQRDEFVAGKRTEPDYDKLLLSA